MRPRSVLAFLLPLLGTLLLLSSSARPTFSADKPTPAELKEKVKGLVAQLADKDPDKQDTAAAELLQLGPDVLLYLPRPDAKLPEAQKRALAAIRKALRDEQIKRDLAPRLVTIDDERPVSKMLEELEKQTGIRVEDRREGTDSKIKLKLNKVTFWQALDAIAKEADGRVDYYRGGMVRLMAREPNYVTPPISYNGIFRTTVRRITAIHDLEAEGSNYTAIVEVAWEPRFRPFKLDFAPADITVEDDKGRKVAAAQEDRPERGEKTSLAVPADLFVRFDVPLGSVERASLKLGQLNGRLNFVGPTRMESFAFPKTLAEMQKDPKASEMTREGVTVKVSSMELAKDHWTLVMALEYPADGPQFESFESWLVKNRISLKSKDGEKTFPPNGGYVIENSVGNRAAIEYNFVDSRKDQLTRGDPADWKLVYETPALMVEVPMTFEFKDVPLP
jgi:hypothetical protein